MIEKKLEQYDAEIQQAVREQEARMADLYELTAIHNNKKDELNLLWAELEVLRGELKAARDRVIELQLDRNLYQLSADLRDGKVKVVPAHPDDTASVTFFAYR